MNILAKTLAIISIMAAASAALAQSSSQSVADRVAKLGENLKKADANGDGIIDAQEASGGVARVLINRVYPNGTPKFPIPISDILKAAEGTYKGSPPPAPPGGAASSPTTASPSTGTSAAPGTGGPAMGGPGMGGRTPSDPNAGGMGGRMRNGRQRGVQPGGGQSMGGPGANGAGSANTPASIAIFPPDGSFSPAAATTPQADISGPPRHSERIPPWKDRPHPGVPDWFIKKADDAGQVTMDRYMESWSPDEMATFEKYDLNHDGIITEAEVLKVESKSGSK